LKQKVEYDSNLINRNQVLNQELKSIWKSYNLDAITCGIWEISNWTVKSYSESSITSILEREKGV
jgi:hypothetical protein